MRHVPHGTMHGAYLRICALCGSLADIRGYDTVNLYESWYEHRGYIRVPYLYDRANSRITGTWYQVISV